MSRKDLGMKNEIIKEHNVIRPKNDDQKWKGCFVFLEEYDEQLLKKVHWLCERTIKRTSLFESREPNHMGSKHSSHWKRRLLCKPIY